MRKDSEVWASSSAALDPASTWSHDDTACHKYSVQADAVRGCLQSHLYWPLGELTSEIEWIIETDQSYKTPCDFLIRKHFWRGQTQGRGSFCMSLLPELQRWEISIFLMTACGQLLNTRGQGGRTPPSLHRLFFCSHFSPPLLKLWCFSGMEECNEMMPKEMIHFLSPLITREVITVNDKWCSSIAKRQISAGAITVRWIDVLFTPPDGEAMGANDLYKEENPEYHKKSLSLALHWGITLCIKAWTRL